MKKEFKSEVSQIANSGGRSSAYMTERLLMEAKDKYIITFYNTGKERDETLDFVHKCDLRWQELYGQSVVWLEYNPDLKENFEIVNYWSAHRTQGDPRVSPFEKLIQKKKYLPNPVTRFCTVELKIRVGKRFMMSLGYKHWTNCVGLRFDEPKRYEKTKDLPRKEHFEVVYPMVEWKVTKTDVDTFWRTMPFDLQLKAHEGNCDLCFLKGIGKKRQVIRDNPKLADWWIRMENKIGLPFITGKPIQSIVDGLANAPEFQFRDDFECDIPCMCSID